MKKIFILFLFSFSLQFVFAQVPTQAEIDKMTKDAQALMKKYGGDSLLKNAMKSQQGNNTGATNALYNSDPGSYGNVDNWKFPAKNTALLSALPKKIFTKAELVNFLNDLYEQLSKKLTTGVAASVQSAAAKYNNDGNKMGDVAIMGWYSSHPEEAILLIVKAAAVNPGNELLLNNCAALLNMSGIEQKAIPILKYLLRSYPDNSMLLNNIGQAYAGLGELDTAMVYFGRCLKIEPDHAEACGTAGFIEESKGHTEKAVEYFEKAIKSGYSKPVQLKLRKLKKGSRIAPLIRRRIKLPEYFNLFKYDLPAQCISTNDAVRADAEHNAFRKMIGLQAKKFGAMYAELAEKKRVKAMQIMKAGGAGRILGKNEFMAQPFYELCNITARDVLDEYLKELGDFSRMTKNLNVELGLIEKEYQQKREILTNASAGCAAFTALANTYLPKYAALTEAWQEKGKLIYRNYFDELVYWHYLSLHPLNNEDFGLTYYHFIEQYLVMMGGLCQTKIIKPCEFTDITLTKESNAIKEIECPLDFGFSFIVGEIELNCDKFSIEGGELLIFKYEKDFKGHQSTLNIGIGAELHLGKNFKVGLEEYAFIKFDGQGRFTDGGIKNEAFVTATAGDFGIKAEVGSTLGVESGWDFNEGPLKKLLAPAPEVPQNKNVKIYKPGK